jgi:hypothetical protein
MKIAHIALSVSLALTMTPSAFADAGHCNYTQQGRMESHQVCEMPTDEATCTAIGEAEGHSNAEFATGSCPVQDLVGTCDKGASKILYFDGNQSQLEIGCGFQGGTWMFP